MVNGHVTEVASLMEGELPCYSLMEGGRMAILMSCYRSGHFNGGRENESCYGGGQFKEGRMVVIEAASNGGGMVMLERWPV